LERRWKRAAAAVGPFKSAAESRPVGAVPTRDAAGGNLAGSSKKSAGEDPVRARGNLVAEEGKPASTAQTTPSAAIPSTNMIDDDVVCLIKDPAGVELGALHDQLVDLVVHHAHGRPAGPVPLGDAPHAHPSRIGEHPAHEDVIA